MPMCIRVQSAPLQSLTDPWDADRFTITIPAELHGLYAIEALRTVLEELGVDQPEFGARCLCGEQLDLLAAIPKQRSNEVIHLGA
ncbi:hypothetical protein [Streptomyces sp. NPDC059224]|uniref:hypothetical protein n=1 Tax=Streptomyces sp. NPDC059224 TaxID=3346775 RepID=UPI0036ABFE9C